MLGATPILFFMLVDSEMCGSQSQTPTGRPQLGLLAR
jgi:hypothetical protein